MIKVERIAGALGAEVSGVDLSKPLGAQAVLEIRKALLENLVIVFRNQSLDPVQQKILASAFGELHVHPYVKGLAEAPEVVQVTKDADQVQNIGGLWHADVTFNKRPLMGAILHAVETPPYGGDTMFANMYMAFDELSSAMRNVLSGLQAEHSAARAFSREGIANLKSEEHKSMQVDNLQAEDVVSIHPVAFVHPETGRKALFVNDLFTTKFVGMSEQESQPLLQFLYRHATREEHTCRVRWQPGTTVFWDNRCTQHYALNDYYGFRRVMRRVAIAERAES